MSGANRRVFELLYAWTQSTFLTGIVFRKPNPLGACEIPIPRERNVFLIGF